MKKHIGPKVLLVDIETAPMLGYVWGLWENDLGLNQVKTDWYILSWSAKWLHEKKVMYMDQRNSKNIEDDRLLLGKIWDLLDQADIIITQNGKHFDQKKLNARFIMNGYQPPSSYRHIDTLQIAKRHFAFTSNKLAYMSDKLNTIYKKLEHKKFPGFELWKACLAGNKQAWNEMEKYNKYDVLSLEELYKKLIPWDNSINFDVYHDMEKNICKCGSTNFHRRGYTFTNSGKFQKFRCNQCGSETRGKKNLLSKEKKATLKS